MKTSEARRKAQQKYYRKNKEYYKQKTKEEMKRVRYERNKFKDIINKLEMFMKMEWNNENYGPDYRIALSKIYNMLQQLLGEDNE